MPSLFDQFMNRFFHRMFKTFKLKFIDFAKTEFKFKCIDFVKVKFKFNFELIDFAKDEFKFKFINNSWADSNPKFKFNPTQVKSQRAYLCVIAPGDTVFRGNVAAASSRWQHCFRFDGPEIWTLNFPLQRQTRYSSTNWLGEPMVWASELRAIDVAQTTTVVCFLSNKN